MNTPYPIGTVAALSHRDGSVDTAMLFSDGKWRCCTAPASAHTPLADEIRPLLVLDYDDRTQMDRVAALLRETVTRPLSTDQVVAVVRGMIHLPKPAEPTGIGAVVETANREQWVRVWSHLVGGRAWTQGLILDGSPIFRSYEGIAAVRVLSEGVTTDG